MRRTTTVAWLVGVAAAAGLAAQSAPPPAAAKGTVTARNTMDLAAASATVVLSTADLQAALGPVDPRTVYVRDDGGRDVLAQPVDTNDDGTFDELVFQVDLAPMQARTFALSVGDRRVFTRDQFRAYGRFVRERRDDFAWENDLVAHRMYGAALETWAQEPLTSSAVDVWFKRTPRLVINDWYMVDDYHRDLGEGGDLYSAGRSRGCGGNGVWEADRLWPSANFRESRVLANGPIRVMFELTYVAWDVNGRPVRERKRITLDAGHRLNRFESHYASDGPPPANHAAGIKKAAGSVSAADAARGILRTWEPVKGNGHFGCGVIIPPGTAASATELEANYLLIAPVPASGPAVYYAGSAWDRGGTITDVAAWDAYLANAARRLANPAVVSVSPGPG